MTQDKSSTSDKKDTKKTYDTGADVKKVPTKSGKNVAMIVAVAAVVVLGVVAVLALGELGGDDASLETADNDEAEIVANCVAEECIKLIETTDSVEKITEVIGVEPEKSDYSDEYTWKLSNKESISRKASGDGAILQATINKDDLASSEVDFSIFTELKEQLENGTSFTYEELVKKMNGVEGAIAGKTSGSKRYIWVDDHGQTFAATISDKDGKCSIISLR